MAGGKHPGRLANPADLHAAGHDAGKWKVEGLGNICSLIASTDPFTQRYRQAVGLVAEFSVEKDMSPGLSTRMLSFMKHSRQVRQAGLLCEQMEG